MADDAQEKVTHMKFDKNGRPDAKTRNMNHKMALQLKRQYDALGKLGWSVMQKDDRLFSRYSLTRSVIDVLEVLLKYNDKVKP